MHNDLRDATLLTGKDGKVYAPIKYIELWAYWYAVDSDGNSKKLRWNDIASYELADGTYGILEDK